MVAVVFTVSLVPVYQYSGRHILEDRHVTTNAIIISDLRSHTLSLLLILVIYLSLNSI
jgi:hypothetical protein